jgi:hypothetical protein
MRSDESTACTARKIENKGVLNGQAPRPLAGVRLAPDSATRRLSLKNRKGRVKVQKGQQKHHEVS